MTLNGKVALVTGGARGIGAGIAVRLAEEGAAVAILDLNADAGAATVEAIEKSGGRAAAFSVDVSDEASVSRAVEEVAETLGAPTILVNNAGVTRDNLLFKMSTDDWDLVMNVHLRGAFLMSRAAQKFMTEAKWGRIVNISSVSALGNRGQANYSAAKAGVQGLTKTLALELGRFGITVNAIAPGFIETDMTVATAERLGVTFEEFRDGIVRTIPVGRSGLPADIAQSVAFFTDERSGYVSGQVLYVSGGPET